MLFGDKYGLKALGIGEYVFVPDLLNECQTDQGYRKMYVRLRNLAEQKGIKVSINKSEGGLNVKRII